MNIGDLINDFLCEVRERGGFANDRDFDLIVGRVFSDKVKAAIEAEREACAKIADKIANDIGKTRSKIELGWYDAAKAIADRIRERSDRKGIDR